MSGLSNHVVPVSRLLGEQDITDGIPLGSLTMSKQNINGNMGSQMMRSGISGSKADS